MTREKLCVNVNRMVEFHNGLRRVQSILCEAVTTALAAESRRCVAADLESEDTCCRSEERVCGSGLMSIVTSSDITPFVSRSLKACWYISLLSFL